MMISEIEMVQTWQPGEDLSICSSLRCVVYSDTQQLVWQETLSHKHIQNPWQDELLLLQPEKLEE